MEDNYVIQSSENNIVNDNKAEIIKLKTENEHMKILLKEKEHYFEESKRRNQMIIQSKDSTINALKENIELLKKRMK